MTPPPQRILVFKYPSRNSVKKYLRQSFYFILAWSFVPLCESIWWDSGWSLQSFYWEMLHYCRRCQTYVRHAYQSFQVRKLLLWFKEGHTWFTTIQKEHEDLICTWSNKAWVLLWIWHTTLWMESHRKLNLTKINF